MDLKNIELINPICIELSQSGNGEFPDSYKLTEKGTQLFLEFGKQCFEAGIELGYQNGVVCTCFEEDNKLEYSNFEDYLKSLENGNRD